MRACVPSQGDTHRTRPSEGGVCGIGKNLWREEPRAFADRGAQKNQGTPRTTRPSKTAGWHRQQPEASFPEASKGPPRSLAHTRRTAIRMAGHAGVHPNRAEFPSLHAQDEEVLSLYRLDPPPLGFFAREPGRKASATNAKAQAPKRDTPPQTQTDNGHRGDGKRRRGLSLGHLKDQPGALQEHQRGAKAKSHTHPSGGRAAEAR